MSLEQVVGFRSGLLGHCVEFGLFLEAQGEDFGGSVLRATESQERQ